MKKLKLKKPPKGCPECGSLVPHFCMGKPSRRANKTWQDNKANG